MLKNLENTILLNSILSDPHPKNEYEEFIQQSTTVDTSLGLNDTINQLIKFKDNGFDKIIFSKDSSPIKNKINVLISKKRTPDELYQYRKDQVKRRIDWLKNAKRYYNIILKEKEKSLNILEKRMSELKNLIQQNMKDKYTAKKNRFLHYKEIIREIDHVICNYEKYTYDEIYNAPNYFFKRQY